MNFIIAIVMACFGLLGTCGMYSAIENDRYYTYQPPLTDHEVMMLAMLVICFVVMLAGIILMIASASKKKSQDQLDRLNRLGKKPEETDVCPNCKLNISKDVTVCPRCGTAVKRK